jgi:hypothetical protein
MKPFKDFYYTLLRETPMFIGDNREDYSLDTIMAQEKYSEILEYPDKFEKVYTHDTKISVDLYEERDGNEIICWFVPTNNKFVYGYVAYNIIADGGIETTSVFNDKSVQFLAYKVYLYYLLMRYKYLISDKRHSSSGKKFWENIVTYSLMRYKVSIINSETLEEVEVITSVGALEKYYGDISFEKYRIRIDNI